MIVILYTLLEPHMCIDLLIMWRSLVLAMTFSFIMTFLRPLNGSQNSLTS
jgi:hypothetical protein